MDVLDKVEVYNVYDLITKELILQVFVEWREAQFGKDFELDWNPDQNMVSKPKI